MNEGKMKSPWAKLKGILTSLLLVMMVLGTSLLSGCGVVEILPDDQETAGLVISELETDTASESILESELSESEQGVEETQAPSAVETQAAPASTEATIDKNGSYTSKDEVALYIHTYGELPSNFITKQEAEDLGWNSSKGNLWKVADGKSIGGSYFGNYEEKLPKKKGRKYYECDINYDGGYRGAERIIYSNDGLIFYTEDHYESFEQLY